jgi:hypothetical protein
LAAGEVLVVAAGFDGREALVAAASAVERVLATAALALALTDEAGMSSGCF